MSENFCKVMMAELQGQMLGMPNMKAMEEPSGSRSDDTTNKKDEKKIKG